MIGTTIICPGCHQLMRMTDEQVSHKSLYGTTYDRARGAAYGHIVESVKRRYVCKCGSEFHYVQQ